MAATHWLRTHVAPAGFGFSPRRLSISEGLRAAFSCAAVVGVAEWLHAPTLVWAAIGALWVSLADSGGHPLDRLRTLGLFTVLSTLASVLTTGAALIGADWAALIVLLLTFFGSLVRCYGAVPEQIGRLIVIASVVAVDRPVHGRADLVSFALIYLSGCLWAMLLSFSIWRIQRLRPAYTALALVYTQLGRLSVELAGGVPSPAAPATAHAPTRRHAVREAIEQARAALVQVGRRRGLGAAGERLLLALESAEHIFSQLIALSERFIVEAPADDRARQLRRRAFRRLALLLFHDAHSFEAGAERPASWPSQLQQLNAAALALEGTAAAAMSSIIVQLQSLSSRPGKGGEPTLSRTERPAAWFALLRANLDWHSLIFRHALRCAVCAAGAVWISHRLGLPYAYWMAVTVVIVQQPYIATTWQRALERVSGSLVGGALAAVLGLLLHTQFALTAAVFPLAALTMAFRPVSYTLFVTFLTPLVVLIVGVTHPGSSELTLASLRALNSLLGGVIAFAGSVLLWPTWEPDRMRKLMATALRACGNFCSMALTEAAPRQELALARRTAGLAISNAEASHERQSLEAWLRRGPIEAALSVMVLIRGLQGIAVAAWLHPRTPGAAEPEAGFVRERSDWIAGRLEGGHPALEAAAPPDSANADAQRATQQLQLLQAATDRYLAELGETH
ncbi:MAG: FUSC family protein [Steroidobacteraceae bacterium]